MAGIAWCIAHRNFGRGGDGMKGAILILALVSFSATAMQPQATDFDEKLREMGIELPTASAPAANYVKAVRVGNLLFLSGHAAVSGFRGKLGKDMTTDDGYQAARSTAISVIATLKQELGDLNKVKRVIKVMGMVNSTPEYAEQHLVMNGFSDLIVAVFGEKGKHARSAVGMGALPFNFAVEIDLIVEAE
jgi:enamine deaminase RidA (YjgF/YER057c/UK114 family)